MSASCPLNRKSRKISINISAPGKVILHGEHSVVYGKLAVAASLGLRTRLHFEENAVNVTEGVMAAGDLKTVIIDLPDLNLKHVYNLEDIRFFLNEPLPCHQTSSFNYTTPESLDHARFVELTSYFLKRNRGSFPWNKKQQFAMTALFYLLGGILASFDMDNKLEPFTLTVQSELTLGAGTGSSASFAVCLAACLVRLVRLKNLRSKDGYKSVKVDRSNNSAKFDKNELDLISKWAFAAERIVHGSPSGIDNTICTYGSMVEFRKGSTPKPVQLSKQLNYILINTQIPRDTKALVERTASLKRRHPGIVDPIMDALDQTAVSALDCIKRINNKDVNEKELEECCETLGELIDLNQNLLRALGVSHPKLDEACRIVSEKKKGGGLHAKLTGAGGGGYAICLVPPNHEESAVAEAIAELNLSGFQATLTGLGGTGVTID